MADVMVYPPHGGKGEMHTRPNASDLVRNAGWTYEPPKGGTAPAPRSEKARAEDQAKLGEAVGKIAEERKNEAEEAAEEQRFSAGKVVDEEQNPIDETGSNGPSVRVPPKDEDGNEIDHQNADGETSTDADTSSDDTTKLTKADVEAMTQPKLRELAANHGVTVDNRWGRTKLVEAVWEAVSKGK